MILLLELLALLWTGVLAADLIRAIVTRDEVGVAGGRLLVVLACGLLFGVPGLAGALIARIVFGAAIEGARRVSRIG